MEYFQRFHEAHERLKRTVHTAWRFPLPRWGRIFMGGVYFCIPVVGGYQVMMWAIGKSHESIGPKGEKLRIKEVEGIGDATFIDGKRVQLGAGGMGGGVKLVVSSKEEQEKTKAILGKVLKRAKKKKDIEKIEPDDPLQ
mmetsp:Transcript_11813/g.17816  ORF Transcript_11813/g.17816 Transcript_11813/m.17816 type:complete len:139 (-) Transcript_11813:196-612(-)